jgi:hypothetical protein
MSKRAGALPGRLQEMGSLQMQGHRPAECSLLTGRVRRTGLDLAWRVLGERRALESASRLFQ